MQVELDVVVTRDNRADHIAYGFHARQQGRHRIDEEHGFEAMLVKLVELVADASRTIFRLAKDRTTEIPLARIVAVVRGEARFIFCADGQIDSC